jgi:glutathione S-transferase
MIRLYNYELSGSCYKVRLLLSFLKVQWQPVEVDFIDKAHTSTAFLSLNPFGELPVLEDGDLRLRDAQAILVYLASNYDASGAWYPSDAGTRGLIHQWLSCAGNELMSISGARLVKALHYSMDIIRLQNSARRALRIMDEHLAGRAYFVTDHPTIADLACFPYSALAPEAGIDLAPYPHLVNWIVRIRELPLFLPMPGIAPLNLAGPN